jgi:shikimate kinase
MANPLPRKTIVLIGMMGAGKSSVGRLLASRLGLPFTDSDAEIEKAAGMSVSQIFEQLGEPAFRDGERKVIARLLDGPPIVLSTGGGAFMNEETRALIKAKGTSVWLKAELPVLLERVLRVDTRPLLKKGDPETILRDLCALREPVYAGADLTVLSDARPLETTVDRAIEALKNGTNI